MSAASLNLLRELDSADEDDDEVSSISASEDDAVVIVSIVVPHDPIYRG